MKFYRNILQDLQGSPGTSLMTNFMHMGKILVMRHPRQLVLLGCLSALIVMTILSALLGWAAPNLIPRKFTHHITTLLFFGFGLWSLWDAFNEGEDEELAEDADLKSNGSVKENGKGGDDLKKQSRPFLTQFFSPILLKAFSITFSMNGVTKARGQALCTTAAVMGGKSLAKQISQKLIALSGGVLFIVFGIPSFLSTVE
ncbi:hypothetical protein POM88_030763 [Heracleum sosnowskyi]|uniref:GDT1 family protein n=1 Tax=Heracleum sosnowskyi TaxID=360622 RepID=A0AAD8HWJ1_9APIA|nr:hypothetical protein POM88_030763 [Heracleum sosnowskyi]